MAFLEVTERAEGSIVYTQLSQLRQIADAGQISHTAAVKVQARYRAGRHSAEAAEALILEPQGLEPREVCNIGKVADASPADCTAVALPVGIGRGFVALADLADAGDRLAEAVFIADDVQLGKSL